MDCVGTDAALAILYFYSMQIGLVNGEMPICGEEHHRNSWLSTALLLLLNGRRFAYQKASEILRELAFMPPHKYNLRRGSIGCRIAVLSIKSRT